MGLETQGVGAVEGYSTKVNRLNDFFTLSWFVILSSQHSKCLPSGTKYVVSVSIFEYCELMIV